MHNIRQSQFRVAFIVHEWRNSFRRAEHAAARAEGIYL